MRSLLKRTLQCTLKPEIRRSYLSPALTIATSHDSEHLFSLMNCRPGSLITDETALTKYNQDWTKKYQGDSSIVVRPQSTEEVSKILKYCNQKSIGVVPQAGSTGLCGGSVPISNEIILSVECLNNIEYFDSMSGILGAQAGCILQDLQDYTATRDHLVPIDLGAKGTCQIGGNVSTNAGGSYYYRYGSLRGNVLGLEVVLANGEVLNLGYNPSHLKDNTGYDLKALFIGAEGTLGIVTKVAILCPRLQKSKCAAFLACQNFEQVIKALEMAKSHLGEILAAFEFMDDEVLGVVKEKVPLPILEMYPYCVLVETHGSDEEHDLAKIEKYLSSAMEEDIVLDGVLAQSLSQVQDFWKVRESCNPCVAEKGFVYKYDVSLPVHDFPLFVSEIRSNMPPERPVRVFNYGHVIDGNLHCNIVELGNFERDHELSKTVEELVLDAVIRRRGSISAEHGLGQYKHIHLPKIRDAATLSCMYATKQQFDPKGILNPGKYLPPQTVPS